MIGQLPPLQQLLLPQQQLLLPLQQLLLLQQLLQQLLLPLQQLLLPQQLLQVSTTNVIHILITIFFVNLGKYYNFFLQLYQLKIHVILVQL